jgi:hypothetical protein
MPSGTDCRDQNWSHSRWCFAEVQQAQALGKVLFPIVPTAGELAYLNGELRRVQTVIWNEKGKLNS